MCWTPQMLHLGVQMTFRSVAAPPPCGDAALNVLSPGTRDQVCFTEVDHRCSRVLSRTELRMNLTSQNAAAWRTGSASRDTTGIIGRTRFLPTVRFCQGALELFQKIHAAEPQTGRFWFWPRILLRLLHCKDQSLKSPWIWTFTWSFTNDARSDSESCRLHGNGCCL